MGNSLMRRSSAANGLVPAVASVFAVAFVCGAGLMGGLLGGLPIIGGLATLVGGVTWVYGVADGYLTGRKKG